MIWFGKNSEYMHQEPC